MQSVGVSTPAKSSAFLTHSTSSTSLRAPPDPGPARAPPPPEIESTITRLSSYRNVKGVLILARGGALIQTSGSAFEGEAGRTYAGSVKRMVEAVRVAVNEADEGVGKGVRLGVGVAAKYWMTSRTMSSSCASGQSGMSCLLHRVREGPGPLFTTCRANRDF